MRSIYYINSAHKTRVGPRIHATVVHNHIIIPRYGERISMVDSYYCILSTSDDGAADVD